MNLSGHRQVVVGEPDWKKKKVGVGKRVGKQIRKGPSPPIIIARVSN